MLFFGRLLCCVQCRLLSSGIWAKVGRGIRSGSLVCATARSFLAPVESALALWRCTLVAALADVVSRLVRALYVSYTMYCRHTKSEALASSRATMAGGEALRRGIGVGLQGRYGNGRHEEVDADSWVDENGLPPVVEQILIDWNQCVIIGQ